MQQNENDNDNNVEEGSCSGDSTCSATATLIGGQFCDHETGSVHSAVESHQQHHHNHRTNDNKGAAEVPAIVAAGGGREPKYDMLTRIGLIAAARSKSESIGCYSTRTSVTTNNLSVCSTTDHECDNDMISKNDVDEDSLSHDDRDSDADAGISHPGGSQKKNGNVDKEKPNKFNALVHGNAMIDEDDVDKSTRARRGSVFSVIVEDPFESFKLSSSKKKNHQENRTDSRKCRLVTIALVILGVLFVISAVTALIVVAVRVFPLGGDGDGEQSQDNIALAEQGWKPPATHPSNVVRGGVLPTEDADNEEMTEKEKAIADILMLAGVEFATPMLDAHAHAKDSDTDNDNSDGASSIHDYEALAWLAREYEGSLSSTTFAADESLVQRFSARVLYLSMFDLEEELHLLNEHDHECTWVIGINTKKNEPAQKNDNNEQGSKEEQEYDNALMPPTISLWSAQDTSAMITPVPVASALKAPPRILFECDEEMIVTAIMASGIDLSRGLPKEIANFQALSSLGLFQVNYDSSDATATSTNWNTNDASTPSTLFTYLAGLENLTSLTLDMHGMSGSSSSALADISKLKQLTHLEMIGGVSPLSEEIKWSAMANLESLTLEEFSDADPNKDTDSSQAEENGDFLPPALFNALQNNLKVLKIQKSTVHWTIPDSIGSLQSLDELVISKCPNVRGPIPCSMASRLSKLTHLDLSSNGLSSTIPASLFMDLKHLVSLDLSFNQFDGEIPAGINFDTSLKNLAVLNLSHNLLSGSIPPSLSNSMVDRSSKVEILLGGNSFTTQQEQTSAIVTAPLLAEPPTLMAQEDDQPVEPRVRYRDNALRGAT